MSSALSGDIVMQSHHMEEVDPFELGEEETQGEPVFDDEEANIAMSNEELGSIVYDYYPADYELQYEDATTILTHTDLGRISTHPPIEPQGGHLYVYDIRQHPRALRLRYRRDMYQWYSHGTHKFGSGTEMQLYRSRFFIRVGVPGQDATTKVNSKVFYDRRFARIEFWNAENPTYMLLQYVGDASSFVRKRITLSQHIPATVRDDVDDPSMMTAGPSTSHAVVHHARAPPPQPAAMLLPEGYPPYGAGAVLSDNCILYDMHHDGPNALLNHEEANDILVKADVDRLSSEPPITPIGGMMFVYDIKSNPKFRCDQYQFISRGCRLNLHFNIMKGHHYIKTGRSRTDFSRAFGRFEYWSPEREDVMLMHYVGDHNAWIPRPHGNCKRAEATPYVRTQPEVLHAIKMQSIELSGKDVYNNCISMIAAQGDDSMGTPASKVPRNVTQVLNHRRGLRRSHMYAMAAATTRKEEDDLAKQLGYDVADEGEEEDDMEMTQFVDQEGNPISSEHVVKLDDGTYALLEDVVESGGAQQTVDGASSSHFISVPLAPPVRVTADETDWRRQMARDEAAALGEGEEEHEEDDDEDIAQQINRLVDMNRSGENVEAMRNFTRAMKQCTNERQISSLLGNLNGANATEEEAHPDEQGPTVTHPESQGNSRSPTKPPMVKRARKPTTKFDV